MNDVSSEIQGVREALGVVDWLPKAFIAVTGKDRASFLHNLLTHDIKGLKPGQGRLACLLDRQGKIRFSTLVHCFENQLVLEMDPSFQPTALQALQQYLISEAVVLSTVQNPYGIVSFHGKEAGPFLKETFPYLPLPQEPFSHQTIAEKPSVLTLVRWDLLQVPGFHLWGELPQIDELRKKTFNQGVTRKMVLVSPEAFEVLRIEAGLPWPGHEITSQVLFNELGKEEMVSFTKGCYVGQEIVARIKYRAHPPRVLTGFLLEGKEVPTVPTPISLESKEVGLLTSACFSPTLGKAIGLGFLKFEVTENQLEIQTPNGQIPAQRSSLPFVKS